MILVRISTGSFSMRKALETAASGADGGERGVLRGSSLLCLDWKKFHAPLPRDLR